MSDTTPPQNSGEIRGTLTFIKFRNESGFLIGVVDDKTTVKGTMPNPQVGMTYIFRGDWKNDLKWGRQFDFKDFQPEGFSGLSGIRAYLMEQCKWIGPVISQKVVDKYGKDSIRICKEDPLRVSQDLKGSGLTEKRAREMADTLKQGELDEQMHLSLKDMFLDVRITRRAVNQIIKSWGREAADKIKENPYKLMMDFEGVGFPTCDAIARKIKYDFYSSNRIRAGILHALQEQSTWGHTCMFATKFLKVMPDLLGMAMDRILPETKVMMEAGFVFVGHTSGGDVFYALQEIYEDEVYIAQRLKNMVTPLMRPPHVDDEGLASDQRDALEKAVSFGVCVITGAPGTGKTTVIKHIVNSFPGARVKLAAPTGKAAKRIQEQSGQEAFTIHRLLEPKDPDGKDWNFQRDARNPIEADIIVLDEVSMVDTWLMARFLNAVRPGVRLILVGDADQLPSVGPGNVLRDIIASKVLPTTELTEIKRQNPGLIIQNCHRIKRGHDIQVQEGPNSDFFFLPGQTDEQILEIILDLVLDKIPNHYHVDPKRDIQVIVPRRNKTILCCDELNKVLQRHLNSEERVAGGRFRVNDKVMQTKNEYDLNVLNGDIGYVLEADAEAESLVVRFEDPEREVTFPLWDNSLELAYAITCHKFQGSEAKIVVVPIHGSAGPLVMQRSWLYTAISRARDACFLVGERDEIPRIIVRDQQHRRSTRLRSLLVHS